MASQSRYHAQLLLFVAAILALNLLERGAAAEERRKIILKGSYGIDFVNPKAANGAIDEDNVSAKTLGVSGFNLPQIKTLNGFEVFAGYEVLDHLDLGFSYSMVGKDIDSSGTTSAKMNVVETVSSGVNTIFFRPYYYFGTDDGFRIYFNPSVGLASYSLDLKLTASGSSVSTTSAAAASNSALSFRGSLGAAWDIIQRSVWCLKEVIPMLSQEG